MMTHDNKTKTYQALSSWVQDNKNDKLLGVHKKAIQKQLRNALLTSENLDIAKQFKPTIGVYGPSQCGKSYLTAKFSEDRNGILSLKLDRIYNFLTEINPPGGRESTALVSRFSTDEQSPKKEFPIKARLLSEADLICILANSYLLDNADPIYPDNAQILSVFENLGKKSSNINPRPAKINGAKVENYLDKTLFPEYLRERFSNIWEWFGLINQLPDITDRAQIYSVFWNFNDGFTRLFEVLCGALEALGHENTIFLSVDSLLPRKTSIIDVTVLKQLIDPTEDTVSVLSNGMAQEIRRSCLSALISEITFQVDTPKHKLFDSADVLDFPGARTRFVKLIEEDNSEVVDEYFLRGKIDYLFHKLTAEYLVDALVFCVDPGPLNVKELPSSLEEWLLTSKSDDKRSNNLFFTLTKFDEHFPDAAGSKNDEEQRFQNALDAGLIQPFVQSEASWPLNWDGKKFTNVFPIRNPNYPLEGYFEYEDGCEISVAPRKVKRLEELKSGFLDAPLIQTHVANPQEKWRDLVAVNGGGVSVLTAAIAKLDLESLKKKKIVSHIISTAENMYEMFSIFVFDGDNEQRLQKEIKKFRNFYTPIYSIGKEAKYYVLIDALTISSDFILANLRATRISPKEHTGTTLASTQTNDWMPSIFGAMSDGSMSDGTIDEVSANNISYSAFICDEILSLWIDSIASQNNKSRTDSIVGIDPEVIAFISNHLSHEVQIQKVREKIIFKIEEWDFGLTRDANLPAIARIASEILSQHLSLQEKTVDEKLVSDKNIVKFVAHSSKSPTDIWHNWLEKFGELIKENSLGALSSNLDLEQNEILLATMSDLTIKCESDK